MILQTPCVQLVRADRHCQPPEQHFRVQGLQEQNPDITGRHMETTLFFLRMPKLFWLLILRWSFLMPPSCSSRSWCRWTLLLGSWSSDLLVNSVEWTKQFATHWPTEPIKQCGAHLSFLVALFLIKGKVFQYQLLCLLDKRRVKHVSIFGEIRKYESTWYEEWSWGCKPPPSQTNRVCLCHVTCHCKYDVHLLV